MRQILVLAAVLLSLLAVPAPAHALSCLAALTAEEDYANAAAIFVGKAVDVKNSVDYGSNSRNIAAFRVDAVYKGQLPSRLTIETDGAWGDRFVAGTEYLVYLDQTEPAYVIQLCRFGTRPLAAAGERLAQLDKLGVQPEPPTPVTEGPPVDVQYNPWEWVAGIALLIVIYLALRQAYPPRKR